MWYVHITIMNNKKDRRYIKKHHKKHLKIGLLIYRELPCILNYKDLFNIKMVLKCNSYIRKYRIPIYYDNTIDRYYNIITYNNSTLRRFL